MMIEIGCTIYRDFAVRVNVHRMDMVQIGV